MHAWGLRLRRATAHSRFAISELINFRDTQPAYAPVQRFQCSLATTLTWLGVGAVRYSFLCMTLSFTTSRRFIPTRSTHECVRTLVSSNLRRKLMAKWRCGIHETLVTDRHCGATDRRHFSCGEC